MRKCKVKNIHFCNLPQNQKENSTCIQVNLKSAYQAYLQYKFRAIIKKRKRFA